MKRYISFFLLVGTLAVFAAGTQIIGPVQTSRFSREALTNETRLQWLSKLGIDPSGTNFNVEATNIQSGTVLNPVDGQNITNIAWLSLQLAARQTVTNTALQIAHDATNSLIAQSLIGFLPAIPGSLLTMDDEVYGAGWNGDVTAPTKNAVYDKVESLALAGGTEYVGNGQNTSVRTNAPSTYIVDITGTLTNNTTGNAATSTAAASATAAATATTASNLVSDVMRQDLYWMWAKISSNRPVRFLALGDSVVERSETFAGVRLAMQQMMAGGGYRTLYNDYPASGITNGGLIYYANKALSPGTAGYSPMSFMALTNGEVLDTVAPAGGVPADTLSIDWIPCSGTSLTIATNTGSGSYATRLVISTASGSGFQVTNVTLPFGSNYNVRVTSSGTNNLVNVGLTVQSQTTNYHTWAKVFISGGLVNDIVTNAGFYKFFTNYQPDAVFIEDKAGGFNQYVIDAMNWTKRTMTNSDVVWVTPSPQAWPPEGGNASQRNAQIEWANTNNGIVFDKWARFQPTNYWGQALFYEDASHQAYGGRSYGQSAFVKFLNLSSDRFAPAGISLAGNSTDISGKANLAGGNTFTGGTQYFPDIVVGTSLGNSLSTTGSASGLNFGDRTTTEYGRLFSSGNALRLEQTAWGTSIAGMVWSNSAGNLYIFSQPAFGSRSIGIAGSPYNFLGTFTGNASGLTNAVYLIAGSNVTITTNADGRTFTIASTGGSVTLTNTTSAAGVLVGGSGSYGIGTNLASGSATNLFYVLDSSVGGNSYTNRNGNRDEIDGAYRAFWVGTNAVKTRISDGNSSFANGLYVDEFSSGDTYFFGKIAVSGFGGTPGDLNFGRAQGISLDLTGNATVGGTFGVTGDSTFGDATTATFKVIGAGNTNSLVMFDANGYFTNPPVAATSIMRKNGTAVTVGSGLSDDGTTLTATGGSSGFTLTNNNNNTFVLYTNSAIVNGINISLNTSGTLVVTNPVAAGVGVRIQTNGNITVSGDVNTLTLTAGGQVQAGSGQPLRINGGFLAYSPSSKVLLLQSATTHSGIDVLSFGGNGGLAASYWSTTNWPAIRVDSATNDIALSFRRGTNNLAGDYISITASNITAAGSSVATNGFASYRGNLAVSTSITVGASPFSWTNTVANGGGTNNIYVYVDSSTATSVTTVGKNGQQIFASLATSGATVPLQPNQYLTLTYTGTAPTARWDYQ